MNDRREMLRKVFEDTERFYNEDPVLKEAVKFSCSNTKLYKADAHPDISDVRSGEIRVTKHRTFEAAVALHKEFPDKSIAVLNFASATRPGGGVTNGASAQEECLCRCSTLYPAINSRKMRQEYYDVNRADNNVLHTDDCIYTPGVVICKTDDDIPERMKAEDFVTVNVISCAAPNLREKPSNRHNPGEGSAVRISSKELYELHLSRAKHIMQTAAAEKNEIIVLGAFGCGAFRNDPSVVAAAYRDALTEYGNRFDVIEFAVYCRETETANYDCFRKAIKTK